VVIAIKRSSSLKWNLSWVNVVYVPDIRDRRCYRRDAIDSDESDNRLPATPLVQLTCGRRIGLSFVLPGFCRSLDEDGCGRIIAGRIRHKLVPSGEKLDSDVTSSGSKPTFGTTIRFGVGLCNDRRRTKQLHLSHATA
jgi:hypothetical protein